ncbi:MAG: hypothetical protein AAF441_23655 [Pseudomonadota bacterium]
MLGDERPGSVLAFSVFTHMFEHDVVHYLDEIAGLMTEGSKLIFTAFCHDRDVLAQIVEGKALYSMGHVLSGTCRTERPDNPLFAISYDRHWLERQLTERGLVFEFHRGAWTGLGGKMGQDWFVARPAGPGR